MICSILSVAMALMGFVGTMFRITSAIFGIGLASYAPTSPRMKPPAGLKIIAKIIARVIAIAVVAKKYIIVFPPTRPSFLRSPILDAPTTSEQKTIGTMSILISLMNRSPSGFTTAI